MLAGATINRAVHRFYLVERSTGFFYAAASNKMPGSHKTSGYIQTAPLAANSQDLMPNRWIDEFSSHNHDKTDQTYDSRPDPSPDFDFCVGE
jgi:hypothetical protein